MARIPKFCCTALLFIVLLGSAHAAPLLFQFSGTVTQVPLDGVFGDIGVGDAIRGSYTFDTSAVDLVPADPATGSYTSNAPFGMTVTIGTHDFATSGSLNIGILNSFVDQYTVLGTSATGDVTIELFLQDNTGSVFGNDHLPVSLPPLAAFAQKDFHFDAIFGDNEVQVDGELNALNASDVPEPPPAGPILAGSMLALVFVRNKLRT